jgi:TRAP-type C4-dicarboxylate transport system permease small subunit
VPAGRILERAERAVGWLEDAAIMLLLVAMTAIVNLQIVARYVFHAPMIWPEEVTRLTLVWLTFLGAAAMGRRAADIAVTTFVEGLSTTGQRLALLVRDAVLVALFVLVAREGVRLADAVEGMPLVATEWPTALLAWPVAIGGALMALHPALRILRQLGVGRSATP